MWCPHCHYGSESCKLGTTCPQCHIVLTLKTTAPLAKNPIMQEAKRYVSHRKRDGQDGEDESWKAPERPKPPNII